MKEIETMNSGMLLMFFRYGEAQLTSHREEVNALNVYPVPDGDTGTNMGLTIKGAVKNLDETMSIKDICAGISRGALMGARGNSGVILSQILRGMTMSMQNQTLIDGKAFAAALQKGVEIAYKSVLKPVEGTILTVSRKAAEGAAEAAENGASLEMVLTTAIEAGRVALAQTPDMLPVLKEAGVVDAGGRGFLYILEGGLAALKGESMVSADGEELVVKDKTVAFSAEFQETEIKYHYCTELMIHNAKEDHEYVRAHLTEAVEGDSLVCVGDEGIIKVHYHSNAPGEIVNFAQSIGELFDIKIENMKEQMAREAAEKRALEEGRPAAKEEPSAPQAESAEKKPPKKTAVVAVSSGEGLSEIFRGLGADAIISGGQTMNPSAEDIMNAMATVPAEEYIILPNNGNIILGAQQVVAISDVPVSVVPSKFMTQGLAALMMYNCELSAAENAEAMSEALADVRNGEITFAIRDTVTDGIEIKADDILVLLDGKIVDARPSVEDGVFALLDAMDPDEASLLTLYYGEDIPAEDAEALAEKIEERFEDLDVEVYRGGQPLYYYLVSLE